MNESFGRLSECDQIEVEEMKIDGACHCGLITFQAEIDPEKVRVCHCTDCQSFSGSAFRVNVPVPADKFSLSGEPTVYVKTADSGARRAQAFCPKCGSPIYAAPADVTPASYFIRVGTIRQRNELPPKVQIWTRYAQPWIEHLTSMPRLEKQ